MSTIVHSAYMSLSGQIVDDSTFHELQNELAFLGNGISRKVYALDMDTVLKVQGGGYAEQNIAEIESWHGIAGSEYERYFARIIAASPSGQWIVMERAERPIYHDEFRSWYNATGRMLMNEVNASDLHDGNVMYFSGGSIKVVDYGFGLGDVNPRDVEDDDEDRTCECTECVMMRHRYGSCSHRTSHLHDTCAECDLSACKSVEHVIARNSVWCQANDHEGCAGQLEGIWTDPQGEVLFLCGNHLPEIGPTFAFDGYRFPRMFVTNPIEGRGWFAADRFSQPI